MGRGRIIYSSSAEETIAAGQMIGKNVGPGAIISIFGDLGAGKTTLIKGIIHALTGTELEEICSPTFGYLNIYEGKCPVFHFDLYRINEAQEFLNLGFDEYLFSGGICCLEWSERITSLLPATALCIKLDYSGRGKRKIYYEIPKCYVR